MSEIIAKVEKNKTRFKAVDADGNMVDGISASMRRKAFDNNKALQRAIGKTGRPFWRLVSIEEFASVDTKSAPTTERDEASMEINEIPEKHTEIVDFIKMMEPDSDEDEIKKRVKNSLKKMGVGEELKLEEFEKAIEGVIPNLDAALSIHFGLRGDEGSAPPLERLLSARVVVHLRLAHERRALREREVLVGAVLLAHVRILLL